MGTSEKKAFEGSAGRARSASDTAIAGEEVACLDAKGSKLHQFPASGVIGADRGKAAVGIGGGISTSSGDV